MARHSVTFFLPDDTLQLSSSLKGAFGQYMEISPRLHMTIANAFYPKVPISVIERKLEVIAQGTHRFALRCKGIRHFKSSLGVSYYIAIEDEQPVKDLHYSIYASISTLIDDENKGEFNLANFTPHVTISGFSQDLVPEVEQAIKGYSVHYEVLFDCFSLCATDGHGPWTILREYPLSD